MMKYLFFLSFTFFSTISRAQESLELSSPTVDFKIKNAGITVNGNFEQVEIAIEPASKKGMVKFKGSAYPKSIKTGIGIRDKHMQKTDYFDTANFPEITIQTEEIKLKGIHNQDLMLTVQIKDIIKEIKGTLEVVSGTPSKTITVEFELNRLDFNLGEKSLILSDMVKVKAQALLSE